MKAAVLETINAPLKVGTVELGEIGKGQVLVKNLVSGICGAQLQEIAGLKGNAKFVPHLLGHEGCGVVEKVGAGVRKVKKGDKVVLHWRKGTGAESDFPVYFYKGKEMRSGKVTTFSEYSIVSENRLTKVPKNISNDFCALLGCGLSTALATIEKEAALKKGDSIMIVGLGGLGACFVKAAKMKGVEKIVCVDIHDSKKNTARALGAHFINSAKEELAQALKKHGIEAVDVIIETSGHKKSIEDSLLLLSGGGRFIHVGQPKPGENIEIKNALHLFGGEGKTIKATQGGQFFPDKDIPRYVKMFTKGMLSIENLITHRTTLDKINEALTLMREGKANRIMIDIWKK